MTMKKKALLMSLLMLIGFSMMQAKIVEVGKPTSNSFLPVFTYCTSSLSEQIYTPAEIGSACRIYDVSFFNEGYTAGPRQIEVYLVHTTQSSFTIEDAWDRSTEWIPFTEDDKVFSGTVTFKMNEWTIISDLKEFNYNGTDNLAVIVFDRTLEWSATASFRTVESSNQSLYFETSLGDLDPSHFVPGGYRGTVQTQKNWMRINYVYAQSPENVIGPEKSTDLPTCCVNNCSFTEQLYTKEEIGMSGTLDGIAFQMLTGDSYTRTIDLYLVETDYTDLSSAWLPCSESQKVFSGKVIFSKGWTMIHFDTPYEYDGTKNLVVAINDYSFQWKTPAPKFFVIPTLEQARAKNYSSKLDPASPPASTDGLMNVKNSVRFSFVKDHDGVIGDGYEESAHLPTNSGYNYFQSEQIYTAEELGEAKEITSLSFFNTSDETQVRDLDIYMVHTTKRSFDRGYQWTQVTDADRVFSGKATFEKDKWSPIPFTKAFQYNGEDNVAIIVDDNTNETINYLGGYIECLSFYAPGQAIYRGSDERNYDPKAFSYDDYEGNLMNMKNQIKLNEAEINNSPKELQVLDYDAHNAMLTWRDVIDATEWQLLVSETKRPYYVNALPYVLTDLEAGTEYTVFVRSIIDKESRTYGQWSSGLTFKTVDVNPIPFNVKVEPGSTTADISWQGNSDSYKVNYMKPVFFEDFENGFGDWTIYTNGEAPLGREGWTIVDYEPSVELTYFNTRSACAVSYMNETHAAYDADNWLISPQVELKGTLKFWQFAQSPTYRDNYEVLLSTTGKDIADFTTTMRPMAKTELDEKGNRAWVELSFDLSSLEGQPGYIAIHHKDKDMYHLHIDNFGIYDGEWTTVETAEKKVTLEGLEQDTKYVFNVTGVMADEKDSASPNISLVTLGNNPVPFDVAVEPLSTSADISWQGNSDLYLIEYTEVLGEVPTFFEDFESGDFATNGWTARQLGEGPSFGGCSVTDDIVLRIDGNYSARLCSYYYDPFHADNWLITPQVDLGSILKYQEMCVNPYCPDYYEVLLSLTGTEAEDFTIELRPMQPGLSETATDISIDLSAYEGQQGYIAFHHVAYDGSSLMIDNFGIYTIKYGSTNTVWAHETEKVVDGLNPNTEYRFRIIGSKGGESDAITDYFTFTTLASDPMDVVIEEGGDNYHPIYDVNGSLVNLTIEGLTLHKDGCWQTICLPFDIDDIEHSILKGADVRTFESLTLRRRVAMIDCLTPVTAIKAGVPYIIRWDSGEDIENPVFKGVVIKYEDHDVELEDLTIRGSGGFSAYFYDPDSDNFGYYMLNRYEPVLDRVGEMLGATECEFIISESLYYAADYLILNTGNEYDMITGISSLSSSEEKEIIYNLAGQRLNKVQKGVNIVNGRKVMIK